jgi:hypothetical protein
VIRLKLNDNKEYEQENLKEKYFSLSEKFRKFYVRKLFTPNEIRNTFFRTSSRPTVGEFNEFLEFLKVEGILSESKGWLKFNRNK